MKDKTIGNLFILLIILILCMGCVGERGRKGADGINGIDGSGGGVGDISDAYPIGTVYISTINQNPAITFGFGTWDNIGYGYVITGV